MPGKNLDCRGLWPRDDVTFRVIERVRKDSVPGTDLDRHGLWPCDDLTFTVIASEAKQSSGCMT